MITAYQAVVDPTKVGRPITIIVEVTVESERLDLLDAVKRRLLACPEVQQLYYVTGEVDLVIIMSCRRHGRIPAADAPVVLRRGQR